MQADGNTAAAQKELAALQRSARKFGRNVSGLGKSLTTAVTAPIVGLAALGVKELGETLAVTAKTDAVFKSMGDTMKVTKGELGKLIKDLERYSAIEGDIIQNAANVGLSFKALAGNPELFNATTRAAVDMSAALGQDMQTTMVQLGKAMQNGAKGAGALSRNGTLAKDDLAKLQSMAAAGVPLWKQQEFILKAVNAQYAGQGKNVDPIKSITTATKNLAESLAVLLLPALTTVSGWVKKFSDWVSDLSDRQRKFIGIAILIAGVLGPILVAVGGLAGAFATLIPIIVGVSAPVLGIVAAIAALVAILVVAYIKNEDFRNIVNDVAGKIYDFAMNKLPPLIARFIDFADRVGDAIVLLVRIAATIVGAVKTAIEWVRDNAAAAWTALVTRLSDVWGKLTDVATAISGAVKSGIAWIRDNAAGAWNALVEKLQSVWNDLKDIGVAITNGVQSGLEWIRDHASDAWKGFKSAADAVKSVLESIKDAIGTIKDGLSAITTAASKISLPTVGIPGMARGGITSGITIAGEDGPEAVIPLGRSARETADRRRVMAQAGLVNQGVAGNLTINVHTNGDVEATARRVMWEIVNGARRGQMFMNPTLAGRP